MASDRKLEHIKLALDSQTKLSEQDLRFNYEPMLSAHPENPDFKAVSYGFGEVLVQGKVVGLVRGPESF